MTRRAKGFDSRKFNSTKKRSLRVETLEPRQLLAADITSIAAVDALISNDPFSPNAFPLDALLQRAETKPFLAGELTVALRYDDAILERPNLSESYWQSVLPAVDVQSWQVALDYDRTDGSSITLVDLEFDPSINPTTLMTKLAEAPQVLWSSPAFYYDSVEDPREFTPNDPRFGDQYHHPLMQNDLAWDITLGDSSIIVAVTDDGVARNHQDLNANIWTNAAEVSGDGMDNDGNGYTDDIEGWDFIDNDSNPNPNNGDSHGTHVAGIAAGRTDNGIGVAGTAGGSMIMPVKFYDSSQTGSWTGPVIRDSFTYAVDNGAQIVSTSYNINGWVGDPNFTAGLQYIHDSGALHFNSAGNGEQANPARQAFHQTLLVANTNVNDVKSGTSNWGTGIDVSAPGSSILSSVPGNNYDFFSGTSMAAPNAAGVAALIWSQNPTWNSYQVAAQLLGTTDSIDAVNPSFAGMLGTGRVNSFRALTETLTPASIANVDGFPANGATIGNAITSFTVEFEGVVDFDAANDPANYEISNAGPDGVFDTSDDEVYAVTVTSQYMLGGGSVTFDFADGLLESGDHRFRIEGVTDPFGVPVDGNGDGAAGGDFETFFSVQNSFVHVNAFPTLASTPGANLAALRSTDDIDTLTFFAEKGETVTAVVTPVNGAATMTVELVGEIGPISAAAPGEAVILPLTAIGADGDYTIQITGETITEYQYDVVRNATADGLVESPVAVDLASSQINIGAPRYAAIAQATGTSGVPDTDEFTIDLTAAVGQQVDVQFTRLDGSAGSTTVELFDPASNLVASGTGGFDPASLSIAGHQVPTPGVYTVRVDAGFTDKYALVVTENMALELELNDDISSGPRDITGLAGSFGFLGGSSEFNQYSNTGAFIDISGTGTPLGLGDDGEFVTTLPFSNPIVPAGSYTISNNGAFAAGNLDVDYANDPLPTSDFPGLALLPFWDDIDSDIGNVYYQLTNVGGQDALIVQWHNRPHFSNTGAATFQLQILNSETIPVRFVYQDVNFGSSSFNNGRSATIGIQYDPSTADQFSYNSAVINNGDVIDLVISDVDVYAIDLSAEDSVTYESRTKFDNLNNVPLNSLDVDLELLDAAGNVLASDANSAADGKNARLSFTATTADTYYLRAFPASGTGEYSLVAATTTIIDGDFNDDGNYDCADIDGLVAQLASGAFDASYDLTGDGNLDELDLDAWLAEAGVVNGLSLPYLYGDADLDGVVDVTDFNIWNLNKFTNVAAWCGGDFTADGVVDTSDFTRWNENKFTSALALPKFDMGNEFTTAEPAAENLIVTPEPVDLAFAIPVASWSSRQAASDRLASNRVAKAIEQIVFADLDWADDSFLD